MLIASPQMSNALPELTAINGPEWIQMLIPQRSLPKDFVLEIRALHKPQHVQGCLADVFSVGVTLFRNPNHTHVGVSNSFDLANIMLLNNLVKATEKNFQGR